MSERALVTGASSGIGAEFAKQLSAEGYEVILVARRTERLEQLASELSGQAHVIPCDLASDAASLPGNIAERGLDVDLLVNNAGFGTHGRFTEIDSERDAELVAFDFADHNPVARSSGHCGTFASRRRCNLRRASLPVPLRRLRLTPGRRLLRWLLSPIQSRGKLQLSFPFGPSTATAPSSEMLTFTLAGISTALFPIRDIFFRARLPNVSQQLASHVLPFRFAARKNTARR